ncbi:MAG: site-specific integrase [candidate division Zixibacteria bacterium]|jgi:integrase|nr:site-specific integrase [candidate division Zixibacteria bacterium]
MKPAFNPRNERIKRLYLEWLREVGRKSHATADNARKALERYEMHTKYEDFRSFGRRQALSLKKSLLDQKSPVSGLPLSRSTVRTVLRNLQDFFAWLSRQPGYKRIALTDIEYFNLSRKETNMALATKLRETPTLEQVHNAIGAIDCSTEIGRRNRALIAFTALTGIRDGALVSLKLKHVRVSERLVEQLGDEVHTKFSKTITTYFFPVGYDFEKIVMEWIRFLREDKLFSLNDPLFPRTRLCQDENNCFAGSSLEPQPWSSAAPVRKIFKEAFEKAGMKKFTPHSFRRTLTRLGQELCRNPAQLKTWSQNLGHEDVMTTMVSYGKIDPFNQGKIMEEIASQVLDDKDRPATVSDIRKLLQENGIQTQR